MTVAADDDRIAGLRDEYEAARRFTASLYEDLDEAEVFWRPSQQGSGIGWHLGHQAAVNHFLVRNLVAAEPSLNPSYDSVFDSATQEVDRGSLPPLADLLSYRESVAARTRARLDEILTGAVGAPLQLREIAVVMLTGLVNHEYQHDCWIGEVRQLMGRDVPSGEPSPNVVAIEGYWILRPPEVPVL
jgi:hypothetical protein